MDPTGIREDGFDETMIPAGQWALPPRLTFSFIRQRVYCPALLQQAGYLSLVGFQPVQQVPALVFAEGG
ncbi:hypothetical protein J2T60_000793 [Natronospira proteinivora]|uniref:Uncharacterized protein n=1 Tax=Natronospira proteinivora TaxID=1807133 RepID=A0ABT1G923_9GAMM|nr:hypothetical protein [Natronospira proteinivora]